MVSVFLQLQYLRNVSTYYYLSTHPCILSVTLFCLPYKITVTLSEDLLHALFFLVHRVFTNIFLVKDMPGLFWKIREKSLIQMSSRILLRYDTVVAG